jgi:hypothetical protein
VSTAALEAFTDTGAPLPADILQKLAKELFNAALNIETDRLRKLDPPVATSLGSLRTPPYVPNPNAYSPQIDRAATKRTFQPGPADGKPFKKCEGWE